MEFLPIDENTWTYQEEVFIFMMWHQILITNLQGIVQQQKKRINNQILWVKGLLF